jgi:hypothetical protein
MRTASVFTPSFSPESTFIREDGITVGASASPNAKSLAGFLATIGTRGMEAVTQPASTPPTTAHRPAIRVLFQKGDFGFTGCIDDSSFELPE